ncbi:MAG TPA: DUF4342 domain-containing protein [Negativicutes bacterium]|jgi:hypothetical protein
MVEEITLEKIDLLRERIGLSYREAKEALERNRGNVVEALIDMESKKQGKWTEEFSVRSGEVIDKVKELIHSGTINKIRIKNDDRILVEIPVSIGAIGAVIMPQLAALGVLVAMFKRCSIEVVRNDGETEAEWPVDEQEHHQKDML